MWWLSEWVRSWIGLCAKRPFFPLEEQMAAPRCTRQGDAATRRSKQGVKTHTNTGTLTFLCALLTQPEMHKHTHTHTWVLFFFFSVGKNFSWLLLLYFAVILLQAQLSENYITCNIFQEFLVNLLSSSRLIIQHFLWEGNVWIETLLSKKAAVCLPSAHIEPFNFSIIWQID